MKIRLLMVSLLAACTPANSPYDVNGDGVVDRQDTAQVLKCIEYQNAIGECLPADVNGDGRVDIKDFNLVKGHFSLAIP